MNQKTLICLLTIPLAVLLHLAAPTAAQAQLYSITNANGSIYFYSIKANGSINFSAYAGPGGSVSIPSTINGLPVTSIGLEAFWMLPSLTSVTIPSSVTSIGNYAFGDCTGLTSAYFRGNAPAANSSVFDYDPYATVYYSPGTSGWSSTFAGRPAILQAGSLQVTITPVGAINAGAKWQVDGGSWQSSGWTLTNLSVGNHAVSFNTVSGWRTPASQIVPVSANSTATTSATYVAIASLQVTISPAAVIAAGAQWQVDFGAWQNSGATVTNLSATNHTVSFKGIDYWSAPANQTVSIKANSVVKATGTYTFNGAGIYNGLFAQGDTNVISSGMLSGLAVTASGTYSGQLLIGDSTNTISGSFNDSGMATNSIARAAKQGGPLTLVMWVNWNNAPLTIAGTVSGANGGHWTANLAAELASGGTNSAEYTALMLPVGPLPGYGYLLMTNHSGAVTLSGALADGTSFSQSVPVSGNGDLPVYGNLYGGTGLLIGWIGLESGSPTGNLTWTKEASQFSALYTNGFTNPVVALQGSLWTNPLPHTAAIDLPSGQLDISGGGLLSPLTFNVAMSNNNTLVKLAGSPTNSLTGTNNPKTGLLTITFGNGAGKATTTGTGAVLQNAASAGGFFLGKTNAGSILLQP
jgi:hypothetical protein